MKKDWSYSVFFCCFGWRGLFALQCWALYFALYNLFPSLSKKILSLDKLLKMRKISYLSF